MLFLLTGKNGEKNIDRREFEKKIHEVMPVIERIYGIRTGYEFKTRDLHGPADLLLREDLNQCEARLKMIGRDGCLTTNSLSRDLARTDDFIWGRAYLFGQSRSQVHEELASLLSLGAPVSR